MNLELVASKTEKFLADKGIDATVTFYVNSAGVTYQNKDHDRVLFLFLSKHPTYEYAYSAGGGIGHNPPGYVTRYAKFIKK